MKQHNWPSKRLRGMVMDDNENFEEDVIHLPIDGVLDLHPFSPKDIGSLIPEYLQECHNIGIYHVRIIHGKGSGSLRKGVHKLLSKLDIVQSFKLADETAGSWGATLVTLHR